MAMTLSILIFITLPLLLACLVTVNPAEINFHSMERGLVEKIDQLLPQTQCGSCGYPGCLPYAKAIVNGKAKINQCPPGGAVVIKQIARLLDQEPVPLDPAYGAAPPPQVAVIDEQHCIGCVKCIRACPVDAIIGAPQRMHTVIAECCTGCERCLPPCPVDCIVMQPVELGGTPWVWRRHQPIYKVRT